MVGQETFVGVQVTQGSLEVTVRPEGSTWRLENDEAGLRDLTTQLEQMNPKIVMLTANVGLELQVVAELAIAALTVALVAPGKLRKYARQTDHRIKTEGLGSWILATYAEEKKPQVQPLKYFHVLQLEKLTARRQQLNAILLGERQAFSQVSGALRARIGESHQLAGRRNQGRHSRPGESDHKESRLAATFRYHPQLDQKADNTDTEGEDGVRHRAADKRNPLGSRAYWFTP